MEYEDLVGLAQAPEVSISTWTSETIEVLQVPGLLNLRQIVDDFGRRSAKAQALPTAITDLVRLRNSEHTLYLAAKRIPGTKRALVLGGLKTGRKRLFIQEGGPFIQIQPVCVLDFYVHEDYQRQGVGFQLFEHFLEARQQVPAGVAYDRPSPKLLGFLEKYFGLTEFIPQNNNFVVFRSFWDIPFTRGKASNGATRQQSPVAPASPVPLLSSTQPPGPLATTSLVARDPSPGGTAQADKVSTGSSGAQAAGADENSLSGAVVVPQALSRAAVGCAARPEAQQEAENLVASTGASATVWPTTVATLPSATANTCAHAHGMADGREQGLAGAMETFCLSSSQPEHKSSHSSGSVLQQQNSRRCFAVVPPWAVHVPLKGGATGSRSGVAS